MNHRRSVDNCNRCQNRSLDNAPGQARQKPEFRSGGIRHRGGVTIVQALVRNLGICASMLRERLKRRPRKSLSTDAKHRDGVMHSSEESTVMALERRHGLIRLTEGDNCDAG
jgi:hypothetical protein